MKIHPLMQIIKLLSEFQSAFNKNISKHIKLTKNDLNWFIPLLYLYLAERGEVIENELRGVIQVEDPRFNQIIKDYQETGLAYVDSIQSNKIYLSEFGEGFCKVVFDEVLSKFENQDILIDNLSENISDITRLFLL